MPGLPCVREYEPRHPKSLRQRLGATTRDAWASCLQTFTSERASHVLHATRPAVKDLVQSRSTSEPEMQNVIASVGDSCDHLHLSWHVHTAGLACESTTQHSRLDGQVRAVTSAGCSHQSVWWKYWNNLSKGIQYAL